jgi:8-oxo-dGTP diphosphatase
LIRVTAAIIQEQNKILIAQRKRDSDLPLKWELPGGKIEKNERPDECLQRELREEFGIETEILDVFSSNIHYYKHAKIELLAYQAKYVSGEFNLNSHEKILWVDIEGLKDYDFAEADIPIVNKLIEMGNARAL